MDPVIGNAEVIDQLEKALAEARQGRLGYVAISAITSVQGAADEFWMSHGGSLVLAGKALSLLDEHKVYHERQFLNAAVPAQNPLLGADYVCYNAATGPMNFDCLAWLIDAEMTRVREGAPRPLKVGFFFGRDGKAGIGGVKREQMFRNVVRPALGLVGAVEDPVAAAGRCKQSYVLRDVVAAAKRGEAVPTLRASEIATNYVRQFVGNSRPVVITLREADHFPGRNSHVNNWLRFAERLVGHGERVIFVRDTSRARETLAPFSTFPEASLSLDMRMALYASAKANLFTSNGPWSLALFSERPWLMFVPVCGDDDPYRANTPKFWRESMGVPYFEQFPWARPDQRIVWSKSAPADDFETLCEAWDELEPQLAAAA